MGQWDHVQHIEEKPCLGGRCSEGMVRSGDKGEASQRQALSKRKERIVTLPPC